MVPIYVKLTCASNYHLFYVLIMEMKCVLVYFLEILVIYLLLLSLLLSLFIISLFIIIISLLFLKIYTCIYRVAEGKICKSENCITILL